MRKKCSNRGGLVIWLVLIFLLGSTTVSALKCIEISVHTKPKYSDAFEVGRAFIITNISLSSLKDNSEKCDESIPNVDMTVEVYDPDGELMGNKLTFDVTQEDLNKGYSFVPKNVVSTYWEDEIPVWKTFKSGTYKIIVKPGMTDINFIHYYENGEGEKSPGEWIEPVEVLSSWEKKFREEDKTFQDYVKGAIDKNQKTAEIWHIGDTEIQGKIKTYAFWALVVGIIGLLINWRRRNH